MELSQDDSNTINIINTVNPKEDIYFHMCIYYAYMKMFGMNNRSLFVEIFKKNQNYQIVAKTFFETLYERDEYKFLIDEIMCPDSVTDEQMHLLNNNIRQLYLNILIG